MTYHSFQLIGCKDGDIRILVVRSLLKRGSDCVTDRAYVQVALA